VWLYHGIALFLPHFELFGLRLGDLQGLDALILARCLCSIQISAMALLHYSCQQFLRIIVSIIISNPAGRAIRDPFCTSYPTNDNHTTTYSSNPTNRLLSPIGWTVSSETFHKSRTCHRTPYGIQSTIVRAYFPLPISAVLSECTITVAEKVGNAYGIQPTEPPALLCA